MRIMVQVDDDRPLRDIAATPWAAFADVIETIATERTKSGRLRSREARENALLRWAFPAHRPPFDECQIRGEHMLIHAFSAGMSDQQIEMITS